MADDTTGVVQYECVECQHRQDEDDTCAQCGADIPLPVRVSPCPAGVTAEDWRLGRNLDACSDGDHEWKSGEHVEYVDV